MVVQPLLYQQEHIHFISVQTVSILPKKGDDIEGNDTIILSNAPQGLYCYIDGIAEGVELTVFALITELKFICYDN